MARLLLGVSGGIAAYKALEVVRLATKAGHAVRTIQTPTAQRFVGAASFAALTGAPVLTDEFERDPARGAFPDQEPPDARPGQPSRAGPQRRRLPDRARVGQHDRQARPRPGRQPADQRGARRDLPAARRARDERPHVGAPGHAGQPRAAARARRDDHRAGRPARWPPSTSGGPAGWPRSPISSRPSRPSSIGPRPRPPVGRPEGPDHRRRHARADRRGALRRQPLVAGAWASPSPRRPPRSAPRSR